MCSEACCFYACKACGITALDTLFCFFYFLPTGLEVATEFVVRPVPAMPTAWETALLVTCVLVFLTNPIGFLNVKFALCFPSSEILNESIALVRMLSIYPLFFWLRTRLCCCFDGIIELEWPDRSLLFFKKLIWF